MQRIAAKRRYLTLIGSLGLIAGVVFYIYLRKHLASGVVFSNTPSFIHAFALTCLSISIGSRPKSALITWILLGSTWEVSQGVFPVLGTFDVGDLIANFCGAVAAYQCGMMFGCSTPIAVTRWLRNLVFGLGVFTCVATSPKREGTGSGRTLFDPVYLSYDALRAPLIVESPRPLRKSGKIAIMGTTLIISERSIGLHIFDNSDPSSPKPLHFISLPGNIDLMVKDGVLLADSFVDLVAIEAADGNWKVVKRIENLFDWNPYQALDGKSINLNPEKLDAKRGVIIGAKLPTAADETNSSGDNHAK